MAVPARAAPRAAHRSPPASRAPDSCTPDSCAPESASDEDARRGCTHAAFLAALAHDLRTPLNAMVGWLHLLTSGTVSDELRERALAGLQRAVEQQRRVVATLDAPTDFADGYRPGAAEPANDGAPAARRGLEHGSRPSSRTRARRPAEEKPADDHPAADDVRTSAGVGLLQGVFVLAVDDDPDVLQMLQSLLEHSGAIVESTTSPDEALRRYASWASGEGERLVLSDLAMQERDGISLMQAVRQLERERNLRRLPAIALSAHFRPDTRREAFEGGFDLFLAKPIDPSVLLNHLRSMLDR
ncbi:MAG TPA: response regulator [Zeimonas sp.]